MTRILLKRCLVVLLLFCIILGSVSCGEKTEGGQTPENKGDTIMKAEDFAGYSIIRSDTAKGSESKISVGLRKAFSELAGVEVFVKTDWLEGDDSVVPTEILIGKTNREQSSAFAAQCEAKGADCGYGMLDGKVVLWGRNDSALISCAEKFKADILGTEPFMTEGEASVPTLSEGCAYYYTCADKLLLADGSTPKSSLRNNILWGVNGHNKAHVPYTEDNTEDIIRLAAEMGSTIYRINYNPTNTEMLSYINGIIDLCHSYGMQVMMCMDWMGGTVEEITEHMTYMAENLKDRVEYFQIFNETDIWAAQTDEGTFYNASDWTGTKKDYYNPERVTICIEKVRAAVDAFHSAAPDAKLVINIGYRHYPILDWYVEAGIDWDIIGIDWYDLEGYSITKFLKSMEKRFPDHDLMICEFNIAANNGKYEEAEQSRWLKTFFDEMNRYDSSRLKAVIIYELLDETFIQTDDKWAGEAHFGIVNTGKDGSIGEPKEGYRTVQEMLTGGVCSTKTVYTRLP
ncbi:MAG: hypothetical protein MJ175_01000 [Clostridia bacterium]|nr:hypothetical protein [Clostridia bacterium]